MKRGIAYLLLLLLITSLCGCNHSFDENRTEGGTDLPLDVLTTENNSILEESPIPEDSSTLENESTSEDSSTSEDESTSDDEPTMEDESTSDDQLETEEQPEEDVGGKPVGDINLLPIPDPIDTTRGGIAITSVKDEYTIVGKANSAWFHTLAGGANLIPQGTTEGETYYVGFESEVVLLRIYIFDQENPNGILRLETRKNTIFTVPNGIYGMQIRLQVPVGVSVDETVVPFLGTLASNPEIPSRPQAMLTIIDDDGDIGFYRDILPIIEEKNVSISSAVTTTRIGSAERWMTWEQIVECQQRGAEILCHTYDHTHDGDDVTVETLVEKYTIARDEMLKRGLTGGDTLVYSFSVFDKAKEAAEIVFKCAINSSGHTINQPLQIDPYCIARYSVESNSYQYDLAKLKTLIDTLEKQGGWMVWMVHTSSSTWTEYNAPQVIRDIIDYAFEKNVAIVSAEEGYANYVERYADVVVE